MTLSHVRGNFPSCGGASPGSRIPGVLQGFALLDETRGCRSDPSALMIMRPGERDFAVRALRGASDFIRRLVEGTR